MNPVEWLIYAATRELFLSDARCFATAREVQVASIVVLLGRAK